MTTFTCATCIFFDRFTQRFSDRTDKPNKLGTCRCNPPIPIHTDDGLRGVWPTVLEHHWCGGHTAPAADDAEAGTEVAEAAAVAAEPTVAAPAREPEPMPAVPIVIVAPMQAPARLPHMVRRICDVCTSFFHTDDPNKFCCDKCMSRHGRRGAA
jgi:hypothetical protein